MYILAVFQSYYDFEMDFDLHWKEWFLNNEDTVEPQTRFAVTFMFDICVDYSYLILATKDPTNVFLWSIVNTRFLLAYLSTRDSIEESTLRNYYQSSHLSGFWFYSTKITQFFCLIAQWRFLKINRQNSACPYTFGIALLTFFVLKFLANSNLPSDKRANIYGKIRQPSILADLVFMFIITLLAGFNDNAPVIYFG